jgi:signal transduction histidine kinase
MIKTVFMNLITNAIKFSDLNSRIEIEREIREDRIVFSVIDHGTGMDEDTLKKIQQPGKHVSKSGTLGEKGSGVGLLLVYDLLKKHGSQPEFSSTPGEGTTVKFSLPVK